MRGEGGACGPRPPPGLRTWTQERGAASPHLSRDSGAAPTILSGDGDGPAALRARPGDLLPREGSAHLPLALPWGGAPWARSEGTGGSGRGLLMAWASRLVGHRLPAESGPG